MFFRRCKTWAFTLSFVLTMLVAGNGATIEAATQTGAATSNDIVTGTVSTNGGYLNMRTGPGSVYPRICMIAPGETVCIVDKLSSGWYEVTWNGNTGYCYGQYIREETASNGSGDGAATGTVTASLLNVRSGPGSGYSQIGTLTKGSAVTILDTVSGWHEIRFADTSGYIYNRYVRLNGETPLSVSGKSGTVTLSLINVRSGPSVNSGLLGTLVKGTVVPVLDANGIYYAIVYNGGIAYAYGRFIELSAGASAAIDEQMPTQSAESLQTVQSLIEYAKRFLGCPYQYAASGPDAFDCTGFTCFVYRHFGISLPRTGYDQGYANYGIKLLNKSDLMPGDLLFFNTIADGDLSDHAGIYLGDGKFIHASSGSNSGPPSVKISDLNTGFYSPLFSWARRVLN